MIKLFFRLFVWLLPIIVIQATGAVELRPDHPNRYVVKEGDTLWDISGSFLQNPWLWPELWHINPRIDDPHLIYPGDVIKLVFIDGEPGLVLEHGLGGRTVKYQAGDVVKLSPRVRVTPLASPIPAIPLQDIQGFLVNNQVFVDNELASAAYVLAGPEGRVILGAGDMAFARGNWADHQSVYGIYRSDGAYIDPDTKEVLGYGALDIGTALFDSGTGEVASIKIATSGTDVRIGDKLLPTPEQKIDSVFYPKPPKGNIDGNIIKVFGSLSNIGQYDVVVLSRGQRDVLEVGDVLAIYQIGATVKDSLAGDEVKLPDERAGVLMVFRVFEKVSYGLVLASKGPLAVGDVVKNP